MPGRGTEAAAARTTDEGARRTILAQIDHAPFQRGAPTPSHPRRVLPVCRRDGPDAGETFKALDGTMAEIWQ